MEPSEALSPSALLDCSQEKLEVSTQLYLLPSNQGTAPLQENRLSILLTQLNTGYRFKILYMKFYKNFLKLLFFI